MIFLGVIDSFLRALPFHNLSGSELYIWRVLILLISDLVLIVICVLSLKGLSIGGLLAIGKRSTGIHHVPSQLFSSFISPCYPWWNSLSVECCGWNCSLSIWFCLGIQIVWLWSWGYLAWFKLVLEKEDVIYVALKKMSLLMIMSK